LDDTRHHQADRDQGSCRAVRQSAGRCSPDDWHRLAARYSRCCRVARGCSDASRLESRVACSDDHPEWAGFRTTGDSLRGAHRRHIRAGSWKDEKGCRGATSMACDSSKVESRHYNRRRGNLHLRHR
jgi:hypothetical protein